MKCIVARIEPTSSTYFEALMPDEGGSVEPADSVAGLPAAIRFVTQWVYLTGTAPRAVTPQSIEFSATGSTLIMQKIVKTVQGVTYTTYRSICRSLGSGSTASVVWGASSVGVAAGQYADCTVASTGSQTISGPYTFNDSAPPTGSSGLIATIDAERTARGLP